MVERTDVLLFDPFRDALSGMQLTHIWRGHGSAIFLEFGDLTPIKTSKRLDGQPNGQMSVMIEWSWRVENETTILCGSWSEEDLWDSAFKSLLGSRVRQVELFGRLPELKIELDNGTHVLSFAASDGDPQWAIFDRRGSENRWISVKSGNLVLGA